jgi:hypothetical protein
LVEGPWPLAPTELSELAATVPCILRYETHGSGRVKRARAENCPPELTDLAVTAAPELIFRGLEGDDQKPRVFLAPSPFLIDRRETELKGRAKHYATPIQWFHTPVPLTSPSLRAPLGMESERCDLALTLDSQGTVVDVRPVSCSEGALEAAEWGVKRWRFSATSWRQQGMVLPVSVFFGPQETLPSERLDTTPFILRAPVAQISECRFHVWRDADGSVLDASPVFCDPDRWQKLYSQLESLDLPRSSGRPEELCLSMDPNGALTQPSPFDHDWMGAFRYSPLAQWPKEPGLDPTESQCLLLFDVDPTGKTRDVRVFDCPEPLQEAALKAAGFWTWTRFNIPNEPDPLRFVVDIPFRDEIWVGSGHTVVGDPRQYRDAEIWKMDPPRYPREEVHATMPHICWARFSVDKTGHPSDVVVDSQCPPAFTAAAMKVLPRWRFFPAQWAGEPVESLFMTQLDFQ